KIQTVSLWRAAVLIDTRAEGGNSLVLVSERKEHEFHVAVKRLWVALAHLLVRRSRDLGILRVQFGNAPHTVAVSKEGLPFPSIQHCQRFMNLASPKKDLSIAVGKIRHVRGCGSAARQIEQGRALSRLLKIDTKTPERSCQRIASFESAGVSLGSSQRF